MLKGGCSSDSLLLSPDAFLAVKGVAEVTVVDAYRGLADAFPALPTLEFVPFTDAFTVQDLAWSPLGPLGVPVLAVALRRNGKVKLLQRSVHAGPMTHTSLSHVGTIPGAASTVAWSGRVAAAGTPSALLAMSMARGSGSSVTLLRVNLTTGASGKCAHAAAHEIGFAGRVTTAAWWPPVCDVAAPVDDPRQLLAVANTSGGLQVYSVVTAPDGSLACTPLASAVIAGGLLSTLRWSPAHHGTRLLAFTAGVGYGVWKVPDEAPGGARGSGGAEALPPMSELFVPDAHDTPIVALSWVDTKPPSLVTTAQDCSTSQWFPSVTKPSGVMSRSTMTATAALLPVWRAEAAQRCYGAIVTPDAMLTVLYVSEESVKGRLTVASWLSSLKAVPMPHAAGTISRLPYDIKPGLGVACVLNGMADCAPLRREWLRALAHSAFADADDDAAYIATLRAQQDTSLEKERLKPDLREASKKEIDNMVVLALPGKRARPSDDSDSDSSDSDLDDGDWLARVKERNGAIGDIKDPVQHLRIWQLANTLHALRRHPSVAVKLNTMTRRSSGLSPLLPPTAVTAACVSWCCIAVPLAARAATPATADGPDWSTLSAREVASVSAMVSFVKRAQIERGAGVWGKGLRAAVQSLVSRSDLPPPQDFVCPVCGDAIPSGNCKPCVTCPRMHSFPRCVVTLLPIVEPFAAVCRCCGASAAPNLAASPEFSFWNAAKPRCTLCNVWFAR